MAKDELYFKTKSMYFIDIKVTYGSTQVANTTVQILITPVNKQPKWNFTTLEVTRDTAGGTVFGYLDEHATDPDDDTLEFFILDGATVNGTNYFHLDSSSSAISVANGVELPLGNPTFDFLITILVIDDGTPPLNTTGHLQILVGGLNGPNFVAPNKPLFVEENSKIGTLVDSPLIAYNSVRYSTFNLYCY